MENLYTKGCIRTFTGKYINVREATVDQIDITDIAHALSRQTRFGGHLPGPPYTVAQHSLLCCELANGQQNKMAALLHDASEAYLLDVPSPIKQYLANYKEIEDGLMNVIAERFGFEYPLNEHIKAIDKSVLELEWEILMLEKMRSLTISVMSHDTAKQAFIDMYFKLCSTPQTLHIK